jgi:hypothetical protein
MRAYRPRNPMLPGTSAMRQVGADLLAQPILEF